MDRLVKSGRRWIAHGGLRPVAVAVTLAALLIALPNRNISFRTASAATSPACVSGVGVGGTNSATVAATAGGHGCVVIKYVSSGTTAYETFNYTGSDQSWTVPSGVTSVIFYLLGAGGGGVPMVGNYGDGGGGGYVTGTYTVSSGQVLTVIVGQRGGGELLTLLSGSGTSGCYMGTSTYGGGGRGSSCWSGFAYNDRAASGGGRSAIRLSGATTDLVTAAGGGGGGWTSNGGGGGGTTGLQGTGDGLGGSQTAGGTTTGGATNGSAYLGGDGYHQAGGGGGGYFGGGGGSQLGGGGGGSSYVSLLTSGSTTAGSGTTAGASVPSTSSLGGCNISNHIASMSVSQTSDGGSPIINYEYHIATSKPASQPTQWTPFDSAQTSSPLTWDMRALGYSSGSYRWYVRAINVIGASTGSWLSNSDSSCGVSVTATAPAAPTSLSATSGSGSASISFTAGSGNGASITNYSYSLDGSSYTALSPIDASSPVTIPGLTGGTAYTIYLKAINSVGSSSASSSVSVTPLAAAPSVSSVSGTSGTTAGGTSITITGTNFLSGATVTVGGAACTSVTVVSSTSITCTTPAGTAGAQNIVVTNTDTQSATLSGGFTYIAAPSAPATPDLAIASDSGSSSTDDITSDNTPTISIGSATNGNTVTVTATKSGQTNVTCTFTAAVGTTSCDLGTLADGTWSVTSKQTNSGIDSASTSALSVTVDATRPTVTSFSSTKSNGTYGIGTTVNITATLSESVADGASITVTLDTGDTVILAKATSTTLTGTYTVGTGDNSTDLAVSSYALTSAPTDAAGNAMTSTALPTGANNIAGAQAIVIDTTVPTLSSATANTAGTQVTLTFSEPLNATTAIASDFAVSVGVTSMTVSSISVSGSTVILTLGTPAVLGDVISVVYTAPTPNSATSNSAIQDTAGNDGISFTTTATVTATTTTAASQGGGGSAEPESTTTTTTTLPTTTATTTTSTTTTIAPVSTTTTTIAPRIRTTTTTAFVPLAPLLSVPPTTIVVAVDSGSPGSTALPVQFTEPNPRIPVIETEVVKIADGVGSVAGMAPDGWVKVEPVGAISVVLTTSDGLRIEIAALTNENKTVRLNTRGMVIVEHDDYITVAGGGLQPNSDASTWLFSTPKELGQLKVDANGAFSQRYKIGSDVHVGDHTAQVNGIAPDGTLRSVDVGVEIIARPAVVGPYKPRSEPRKVVDLTVEAMVLLAALGAVASRKEERESGDVAEVSVSFRASNTDDRSDAVHPPVLPILDRLSYDMPTRIVRKSPMVARVFADGAYLRALIGWLWVAMPLLGVVVGVLAARDTNYEVVMPSLALMATLMVIGIFDSLAGFIAVAVFAVLANFHASFDTADSVRGILGIWVLAFAVSLAGSAMRPFRRLASGSLGVWQRATDFVLITLFGAWVAGAMFSALPALTGIRTVDADRIGVIRVVALLALAARYALENTARVLTPSRLTKIENQQLPEVPERQKLVSAIIRTCVFMFVALVFIGNNWAWWLGGVLYLAPKLIGFIDERFPDFKVLHRFLPRGIFKIVLMLFVAKWWGGLVADNVPNPDEMVQYGFVLLGIPGLVLTVFGWFGRSSKAWPSTFVSKLLGIVLLIIGLVTVL